LKSSSCCRRVPSLQCWIS